MKSSLIKLAAWVTAFSLLTAFIVQRSDVLTISTAQAVGDLTIDWGVPEGQPIFTLSNFAPGQTEAQEVIVTNNASSTRPVAMRGTLTQETNNLPDALLITVSANGSDLYGGSTGQKTLRQFFADSAHPDGIPLLSLNPGQSTTLIFTVTFNPAAGNTFQAGSTTFDISLGVSITIPASCQGITFAGDPIFGTEGSDSLRGTLGNDLIIGLEGSDSIRGLGGDDCIMGGAGSDSLRGGPGHDQIFGEAGSDSLDGEGGNDQLSGGAGSDRLSGGLDNDTLFGGSESDSLDGGNGNDIAHGEGGSDALRGGSGNDELRGGAGSDSARGEAGSDSCEAESIRTCETTL